MDLATFILDRLDKIMDLNDDRIVRLEKLFSYWNAHNIDVDVFKKLFGFDAKDGVFMLLPFMTEYATSVAHTSLCNEFTLNKGKSR